MSTTREIQCLEIAANSPMPFEPRAQRTAFIAAMLMFAALHAHGAVGPRVPVGPQDSIACPSGSVHLAPGKAVQPIVDAHPPGTTYCFAAGIYVEQQIKPHTKDRYFAQKGTVLDGKNNVAHAFYGSADDVTISNFTVQNYNAPSQDAPINNRKGGGKNWMIGNNEIAFNAGVGVEAYDGTQVIANYIHHNRQEGYACIGKGVRISDNEIAFNNPDDAVDPGWEAGGGKCWQTTGLVVRNNYSHDNHGPGLWTDTDNRGVNYQYNNVENNWGSGIFHEVSWDAVIAHNTLKNNARLKYCKGWLWCSDIQIAASGGANDKFIDIYDNDIVSDGTQHGNAIGLLQQKRGAGPYGTYLVQNVWVHDNRVDVTAGGSIGAVEDNGNHGIFTGAGICFGRNVYRGLGSKSFEWNDTRGSLQWFQSQQQETKDCRPPAKME